MKNIPLFIICALFFSILSARAAMLDLQMPDVKVISWIRNESSKKILGFKLTVDSEKTFDSYSVIYGKLPSQFDSWRDEPPLAVGDYAELGVMSFSGDTRSPDDCGVDIELLIYTKKGLETYNQTIELPCNLDSLAIFYSGKDFEVKTGDDLLQEILENSR